MTVTDLAVSKRNKLSHCDSGSAVGRFDSPCDISRVSHGKKVTFPRHCSDRPCRLGFWRGRGSRIDTYRRLAALGAAEALARVAVL